MVKGPSYISPVFQGLTSKAKLRKNDAGMRQPPVRAGLSERTSTINTGPPHTSLRMSLMTIREGSGAVF